jgi:hypothetical protein
MAKTRIYIFQLLGILVLLCGYFLSDQPDSLSVMHFDPNPASPSVITKALKSTPNGGFLQTSVSSQNSSSRKTNVTKHISFEILLPHLSGYHFVPLVSVVYTCPLPENYSFQFYEEINPPPPKIS